MAGAPSLKENRPIGNKNAENGNADFHARVSACTRVGGPSNPQIRDKRAPEIIFNPLITILAPKLIEIQYILENGLIVDILRALCTCRYI